jgi:phage-related protein
MKMPGRRGTVEEVLAEVVDTVEQSADELASGVPKRKGSPLLVRLVVAVVTLLVNAVRGLVAGLLSAVGGLVGGAGGAVAALTSGLRTTLQGLARTISPRKRRPVADAVQRGSRRWLRR